MKQLLLAAALLAGTLAPGEALAHNGHGRHGHRHTHRPRYHNHCHYHRDLTFHCHRHRRGRHHVRRNHGHTTVYPVVPFTGIVIDF